MGHDSLVQMYRSLDLADAIDRTLTYFAQRVDCANALWIDADIIARLSQVAGAPLSTEARHALEPRVFRWRWDGDVLLLASRIVAAEPRLIDAPASQAGRDRWHRHLTVPCFTLERDRLLGVLVLVDVQESETSEMIMQVAMSLASMSRFIQFAYEYRTAKELSYLDDLTQLYNQRYLFKVLDLEVLRSARDQRKFSVLFIDVDYFKLINDTKGHIAGSQVLVDLGRMIQRSVRETDYAFRYGGDEFVIVLPNTDTRQAQGIAERLRANVESSVFAVDGVEVLLTVSIGLATFPDHAQTREQILQLADQAMYYGKYKSRNIVYVAS
jgi:diguanylate cyclase (GGDEF)-like protein